VELALGHVTSRSFAPFNECFNPCFRGTCPRTVLRPCFRLPILSFNPCFRGTCPRTSIASRLSVRDAWFQSLFSWNLPSDRTQPPRSSRYLLVSILVFVELALGPNGVVPLPRYVMGFNPCFRGTCPRTLCHVCYADSVPVFQSLFSWNLPSDINCQSVAVEIARVSILVFVELALGQAREAPALNPCTKFQSLFSWNLPSDANTKILRQGEILFQSLFSWNLPSDLWDRIFIVLLQGSFNPCFRGTCPRTISEEKYETKWKFQSLFSWNLPSDEGMSLE